MAAARARNTRGESYLTWMSGCGENFTMGVQQPYTLFVPASPGIEPILLGEIRAIGGVRPQLLAGGVEFEANDHVLYRALLELGTGIDVRIRLGRFTARYLDALVRQTALLPWSQWVGAGQTVEVRAAARKSRLMHTGAIEERVMSGIRQVVGSLASEDPEPWRVFARIENDQMEISLSLAGAPLHQRGYRLASGKAPLREDLARSMLELWAWPISVPIVDPFCGSGTLLIEAARKARGIPPGWGRDFHVQRSPSFDELRWASIRERLSAGIRASGSGPVIMGSDRDAGAIAASKENAERAGVTTDIRFDVASLSDAPCLASPPAGTGWWVSNPPYGARVRGGADLRSLYQTLGRAVSQLSGWKLGLVVDDPRLAHSTGLELKSLALLTHGGKKVRVYGSP